VTLTVPLSSLALVHNSITLDRAITLNLLLNLPFILDRALAHHRVIVPDLERSLQQLKQQPDPDKDTERFQVWWKTFGGAWTEN